MVKFIWILFSDRILVVPLGEFNFPKKKGISGSPLSLGLVPGRGRKFFNLDTIFVHPSGG